MRLGLIGCGGIAHSHLDDSEQMLRTDLEAVTVCLPHHLHKEAAVAASQAG